ncbi:polyhydroxybutyrate depolymerase [Litorivivens lipolytica]|uniref:Polyhydroxybutyrate depolymerase n=1 Tax=Litorivivens lipolytica TaxID=1524264 RepID=A0A7W4W6D1_9GAMM|nr:PHB depolymerase family esterase [Litorivivens lipolytica]MBB3048311.1 polyhydroxybutyrate depolymerase [Litorivivens lipolytica]
MKKRIWLGSTFVLLVIALLAARSFLAPGVVRLPQLSGELQSLSLQHGGIERHYHLYKPAKLPPNPPLLLVFHGSMGSGESMREMSARQFDRLADEQGLLVVYPDGFDRHWNDCRASASYEANRQNIDDVGFVRQLITELIQRHGVDSEQVYGTGLSNGGHMVLRLALETPELLAGYAPIVANLPVDANLDCDKRGAPVNIALIEGTNDPVNPYDGGLVKLLWDESRGEVLSAAATAQYFAGLVVYGEGPEPFDLADTDASDSGYITAQLWYGKSHRVGLFTMQGGGHVLPSVDARFGILGGDIRDLDAADLIWAFLRAEPAAAGLPD